MECRKQLPLSFIPALSHGRKNAQIVVRCIVGRINRQKVLQPRTRLRVILLMKVDIGQQFLGARVPRFQRQCGLEFLNGLLGTVEAKLGQGQIEMRLSISAARARSLA